jgi:hypothetical protein
LLTITEYTPESVKCAFETIRLDVLLPAIGLPLKNQKYCSGSEPDATTLKVACDPKSTELLTGGAMMTGGKSETTNSAGALVTAPSALLTTTR